MQCTDAKLSIYVVFMHQPTKHNEPPQTKHRSPREVRRAVDDGHRDVKLFDERRDVPIGIADEGVARVEDEDVVGRDVADVVLVLLGAGDAEALIGRQSCNRQS